MLYALIVAAPLLYACAVRLHDHSHTTWEEQRIREMERR